MATIFDDIPSIEWTNKSKKELIEVLNELHETITQLKEKASQQQTSEQALQQEIDFTMNLIHSAPTFFITLTSEGNTLMMNETMLKTLGYTNGDVVGKNCANTFISPDDIDIIKQGLTVLAQEKKPTTLTVQTLAKNGSKYLIEWHCTPVLDKQGVLEYLFGIGIDITKREEAAQALSESTGRYQDLFDTSPDSITIVNLDGMITDCNQATELLIGYRKEEIIGKRFTELLTIDPSLMEDLAQKHQLLKKGEMIKPFELIIKHKDGAQRIIEVTNSFLQKNGTVTGFQIISRDITERIKAQQALSSSEEKYKTLVDQSLQGIVVIQNMHVVFTNDSFASITGYTTEEIYALSPEKIQALVHPDHQAKVWGRMKERLSGKDVPEQYDFMGVRKDGTTRWLEMFARLIKFNKEPAVQATIIDITDRKGYENMLKIAEEKFRTIFDCASDAIFIHNMDWKFLEVNKTACERLGYSRDELLTMTPTDIDTPDFRLLAPDRLKEIEEKGQLFFETAHLTKNGKEIAVELSSRFIHFAGEPAILSVARDITERKRMQRSLEDSEKKYRSLVDNALVGVYKSTLDGKMLYVNEALANMFEFDSPADMIRQGALVLYKSENDRTQFLNAIQEKGIVKYFELELLTKHKRLLHVLVSAFIDGEILSGMIMDITERKRMEEELKSNVDRLKQIMTNTVDSMASILETRDPYTAGHQQRVAQLAVAMAKDMNLSEDQLMGLNMAAVIHDIGKIYVPAEILTRPSKLTESEFALIKTHPKVGYEILKRVEFPWPVATIVLQHHERFNGSGYPQGLKGKNIILESRILAVADVVEAMSSHRPYRPAKSMEETLEEIIQYKGEKYDPIASETCVKLFRTKAFSFNTE